MRFGELTSYEINDYIDKKTPVILPLGAIEAHGPHLPLNTDNILAEGFSEKLCKAIEGLMLPVVPFGQVWSLKNFPGSLTISDNTLTNLICEIGESLYLKGIRVFVITTGHLGNMNAMKAAARILYDKYRELKTYYIFYPGIYKLADEVREGSSSHKSYIHADEIETSLMLYINDEKVYMDRAINGEPKINIDADFTTTPWEEFTDSAVLGEAKLANYNKGKYIIEESVKITADMINKAKMEV